MRTKNKIIIIILSVLPIVQTLAASVKSEDIIPSSLLVALQDDGTLVMQARGIPLGRILDEIRKACMVEIVGLENRRDELIGFALQSVTIEKGVKRFLRRLGENNYAFEYIDRNLRRARVFPEAETVDSSIPVQAPAAITRDEDVTVVRIEAVINGYQAEALYLSGGDLIIAYDGVEIHTTRQLIEEVRKKAYREQIEMIVVSNRVPMRFMLSGGFIGVRIRTVTIPKDDFEHYHSGMQ